MLLVLDCVQLSGNSPFPLFFLWCLSLSVNIMLILYMCCIHFKVLGPLRFTCQFLHAGVFPKERMTVYFHRHACAQYCLFPDVRVCIRKWAVYTEQRLPAAYVFCHEARQGWRLLFSQHFKDQKQRHSKLQGILKSCLLLFVFWQR